MTRRKKTEMDDPIANPRDVEAHANKERPARRPLTTTYKLSLPDGILDEENFRYRWIRNNPDRVMQYESAWWTIVKDEDGKIISKPSGSGEHLLLYKIEKKYFEEDREINRQRTIDLLKDSAKLAKNDPDATEYIPEGHEAVVKFSN